MKSIKSKSRPGFCIVTVQFERSIEGEEVDVLQESFKAGIIKVNPRKDLKGAVVAQTAAELQEACDNGFFGGHFQVQSVAMNRQFDFTKPKA